MPLGIRIFLAVTEYSHYLFETSNGRREASLVCGGSTVNGRRDSLWLRSHTAAKLEAGQ